MRFILFLFLALCWSCAQEDYTTTVFLVRHAEMDHSDTSSNPPLSRDGFERAQKVTEMLQNERIDAIFSTYYRRNMQTVNALAKHKNLEMKSYDRYDWMPMTDFILENMKGQRVVISGHGDNMLEMIVAFGGTPPLDSLGTYEHDKMFTIRIKPDTTLVEMIEY